MSHWSTSVQELFCSFRQSLNDLVPVMKQARILDHQLNGFDDWDRVVNILYDVLVITPLRSSLDKQYHLHFDLPDYETEYESYCGFSLLSVNTESANSLPDGATRHFFRFISSGGQLFDKVETVVITSDKTLMPDSYELFDADHITVTCRNDKDAGGGEINQFDVNL